MAQFETTRFVFPEEAKKSSQSVRKGRLTPPGFPEMEKFGPAEGVQAHKLQQRQTEAKNHCH